MFYKYDPKHQDYLSYLSYLNTNDWKDLSDALLNAVSKDLKKEKPGNVGIKVHKDTENLVCEFVVPGFKKSEIEVSVDGDILKVECERQNPVNTEVFDVKQPLNFENISKTIHLDKKYRDGEIEASLDNGILKVVIKPSKNFKKSVVIN